MANTLRSAKQWVRWYAKFGVKVVLSYFSTDYRWSKKLGVFEHGAMEHAAYAYAVFHSHVDNKVLDGRIMRYTAVHPTIINIRSDHLRQGRE